MRMHAARGLFFVALVAACGDGENPAAPTPVTTATSLTIVGPAGFSSGSTLTIGQTVSLRASLELSDGTRRDVDAEWQSSNTTIATVDQSGMVTARAAGVFDVSASAEGLSTRLTGLRVDPPENRPPTVTIETPSQTVDGGGTLQMRATARDPEGSIDRIRWTQTGGSFIDNTVEDAVWNVPVATSTDVAHRLRITVTDAAGETATDVVTITVRKAPDNRPPTVTIETPSQTVDGGGTLQMRATARDPEGSIDRIRWTQTGGSFIDNTVEDAVWNVPTDTSTDVAHRLRITVTDAAGATATDVVTITVRKAPENRPPTVTIETPSQTVDGGGTLQMRATARDPEGSIDRIRWTQTGGSFIDNTVEDAVWNVPVATSTDVAHRLRITVTDAAGATATDVVTITVRKVVVGEVGACRSGLTVDPRQWCTVGAAGRFEVEVGGRACLVDGVGNMVSRFCSSIRVEVRGFRANRIADSESWRVDAFDWNLYEANKSIWITALR